MPKKLLERLGLRRHQQAPVGGQNPVQPQPQQPQPGNNQNVQPPVQQPVQQQPPQQQQPIQPPQQPQQQPWQAPVRQNQPQGQNPQQPQRQPRGNMGQSRVIDAQRRAFEKHRSESMPEVQRAKQLMLTIDGQRIDSQKQDKTSETSVKLVALSNKMQAWQKTIDDHSKQVRIKAEAQDFPGASDEVDHALAAAKQMLAEEDGYYDLLTKSQIKQPRELSGDFQPTNEFREARDEGDELKPLIEEAQKVTSDNPSIKLEQSDVNTSYATYVKKMEEQDYAAALAAIREAAETANVVKALVVGENSYVAKRAKAEDLILTVAALDPQGPSSQERQQVIDDFRQSRELADRGKFTEAENLLAKAKATAKQVFPDEALLVKYHRDSLANVLPAVERALAAEALSQPVGELQKKLTEVKAKLEKASSEHRYDDARALMEVAASQANSILRLAAAWDDYAAAEERAQVTISAALKLKPTKSDLLKQQKSIKVGQEAAAKEAMAGNISAAHKTLATVVSTAEALLAAVGSPSLVDFCKELSQDKKLLDDAANFKSDLKVVTDLQSSLAEARAEVDQALQAGDAESALYLHSIAVTRATFIHQTIEQVEALQRAQQTYQPKFDAALQVPGNVPGVADAQKQLNRELLAAKTQAQTDPRAALTALQQAVRTAAQILAVGEAKQKQDDRYAGAKETLDQVKKTYLTTGMSDNIGSEQGLKDGQQFDAVLVAMKTSETQRTEPNFTALEQAAGTWLATFNAMTEEQKADKTIQRRKQICESALKQAKHLKMATRLEQIGPPPWDLAKEDEAADLHVKMLLETGDVPLESEKGASGAAWIKSMDYEEGKAKRNFIFKKSVGVPPIIGFPPDGEAPREVLGDEVGKQLAAATGLNFNVPETRLVGIDSSKIPGAEPGTEVLGSAQQAAPTIGSVFDVAMNDPETLKKVPAKEAQKMAVYDMVSLNMDRHQDNFLITPPDGNGESSMVPIDNGLAFPTRAGLESRRGKYSTGKALEWLPQAYEPFDPEILAAIDAIDAEEIIGGLSSRLDTMDQQHPELKVKEKVTDESLNLMRRSVAFMKKGAKELSPVYLQDALMTYAGEIFDTPDSDWEKVTDAVIARLKKAMGAYVIFNKMSVKEKADYHAPSYQLGWNEHFDDPVWKTNVFTWDGWARREPEKAIAIHDRQSPNPEVLKECRELEGRLLRVDPKSGIPAEQASRTPYERVTNLRRFVEEAEREERRTRLLKVVQQMFPGTEVPDRPTAKDAIIRKLELFIEWGGDKLKEIDGTPVKNMTFSDAYNALSMSVGQEKTRNLLHALLTTRNFVEMNEMVRKVMGQPLDLTELTDPKVLQNRLKRYAEFKALGGLKAYTDFGFDWEKFDYTFGTQLDLLRGAKRAQDSEIEA